MEEILKQFEHVNLYDGCSHLLHFLGVKHTQEMKDPITYADYAEGVVPQYVNNALRLAKSCYYIGEVCDESIKGISTDTSLVEDIAKLREDSHYKSMMLFAVDLREDSSISRTDLSVLTRAFNRLVFNFPVTVFFRHKQYLSIGTCERSEYKQEWRQGEKLGRVSILRDINCLHPHRGHLDILKGLDCSECSTFDKVFEKWTKVFNSELLTKKFYNDLFEWYQWAVDPETKVTFPGDADVQNDDRENIDTRVIRLITRLMFVWFIKQKHLIPDCIFDIDHLKKILKDFDPLSTTEANYYQAILQNLFFGTLNRAIIEDGETRNFASNSKKDLTNLYRYGNGDKDGGLFAISDEEVIEMFANVPYLNCGLFECLDKTKTFDGVDRRYYNDGFSRNNQKFADGTYRYRAVVPNILFFEPEKGLISIFEKYVFTIEENTPQDVQVALDPELLGKVFENLLGAYNPETKETARNQSGSFYTPREIVQYMVNESLVAHLKRTVGAHLEAQFRDLLDFSTETVDLTDADKKAILHSLFTCKILDPACGSGAFPMGMLQQMVHILQQVDPDNTQWKDVLLEMAVDESRRAFGIVEEEERKKKLLEIEETFNNALNSPDYTRKLYIIESCIYGVDIQPIAMLITRLRFFITLICEQTDIKWDKPEENFGIKTLPNLESKFVAANSLIDADIHQYNEDWTKNEELAILKDELMAIRRRHFYTRKRNEKMRLLREDERKREQIHTLINKLVGEPNQEHIAELERVIGESKALLPKYAGEKWTEELQQTDLFAPPTPVRIDVNKRQRDIINERIKKCEQDIERELHKCTPQGFEAAVLQVTDWNPYDQNSVSPFLDIEWMFGVADGFDIIVANPPYISTKDVKNSDKVLYEAHFGFSDDTYNLFTFRGFELLKEGGSLTYITPKTFWTTQTKRNMRDLILSKNIDFIFDTANPFEAVMVDTCIIQVSNVPYHKEHKVDFWDGSVSLTNPIHFLPIKQETYRETQNAVIFKPTELNLQIWNLYGQRVKTLYDEWWEKIKTSRDIEKNKIKLEQYRASLKPGDIVLLGCLTEGGQGLATANNGRYVAIRKSSKWAENVYSSRPKKLVEAIQKYPKIATYIGDATPQTFLESSSEQKIADTFDRIKEIFGRDVFGQGYIYKLIDDSEIANVDLLTEDEKQNGIDTKKPYYVPYDKGDKDGNRWYLETPFAIAWSKENVHFLKTNSGKKGEGMPVVRNPQFYFKEGFCWNNVLNPLARLLKVKMKSASVNDVGSMSLSSVFPKIPNYYIVTLLNSDLLFEYYREYLNCTVNVQINDIRQIPIIVPSFGDLKVIQDLFNKAYKNKKNNLSTNSSELIAVESQMNNYINKLYKIQ